MNHEIEKISKISKRILNRLNPLRLVQTSNYKLSQKAGAPPGTLIYTGQSRDEVPEVTLHQYEVETLSVITNKSVSEIISCINLEKVNWINISALTNIELIQATGDHFRLHPLVLEDILTTQQLPNTEDYEQYIFFTLKMISINPKNQRIELEHVSFILGYRYLISFQERKADVLEPVRQRLTNAKGRIRSRGSDYLLYALIDVIVDNYYLVTENLNERINDLEVELIDDPDQSSIEKITAYKKQLIQLKKVIYPLREALRKLIKDEDQLIAPATVHFYEDIISNVEHIINTMEIQREMLTGLMELYMSTISNKMNNVMKTLTIIATIFIPLTFVAGVYGMNFKYMPELEWHWGYPTILGVMFVLGMVMFIYMKSRKWF